MLNIYYIKISDLTPTIKKFKKPKQTDKTKGSLKLLADMSMKNIASLEGRPTKAKMVPSPHEVIHPAGHQPSILVSPGENTGNLS